MTDVKTLGIKKNMLEIVQDKLQYSTICEQIHSSTGVREVCATTRPRFRLYVWMHISAYSGDQTRHQQFCGRQHLNCESPPFFTVLVERLFIGREISLGIQFSQALCKTT